MSNKPSADLVSVMDMARDMRKDTASLLRMLGTMALEFKDTYNIKPRVIRVHPDNYSVLAGSQQDQEVLREWNAIRDRFDRPIVYIDQMPSVGIEINMFNMDLPGCRVSPDTAKPLGQDADQSGMAGEADASCVTTPEFTQTA